MTDLISLIVTTWNQERALNQTLRALATQSDHDFEVVVADDGSDEATAQLIARWRESYPVPLRHAWQEHRGFRAAESRNRAVLQSRGSYCVFLDGDCVPRPDFVAAHRRLAEPGWFVSGNRVLLAQMLTERIVAEDAQLERWRTSRWIKERLAGGINRILPLLQVPLGPLRKLRPGLWRDVRSCNLGMWRADFDAVDGFDGTYVGWGREDSDLLVRLVRAGVRRKHGELMTGVLHLWHPVTDRSQQPVNDAQFAAVCAEQRVKAVRGLSTLTAEPAQAPS